MVYCIILYGMVSKYRIESKLCIDIYRILIQFIDFILYLLIYNINMNKFYFNFYFIILLFHLLLFLFF